MRINLDKLQSSLSKQLPPVCLIAGDEPLLVLEAADSVRKYAAKKGFADKETFYAERQFDWEELLQAGDSMSLFASQKLLDLRMSEAKPGRDGSAALVRYCENPSPDNLLLITAGKMDAGSRNAAWVKAIDAVGMVVQVWPVKAEELPRWVAERLQQKGLRATRDAIQVICDRVEGNLLAASQEINKLALLADSSKELEVDDINSLVADSSRFDAFGLIDAALSGDVPRVSRMVENLHAEGVEVLMVLGAISRELRSLIAMSLQLRQGRSVGEVMAGARVWKNRQSLVSQALQRDKIARWPALLARCSDIDQIAKGIKPGSPWHELLQLALAMAGATPVSTVREKLR